MIGRLAAPAAVVLLLAGCGGQTAKKQAETLASLAAEGALLAHDAAADSSTASFTKVHALALAKKADQVGREAKDRSLAQLAGKISGALERFADAAGDRDVAAEIQRRLEQAAEQAGELEERA